MNRDTDLIAEAYKRIYLKIDEDFQDRSPLERAEGVYGDSEHASTDDQKVKDAINKSIIKTSEDFNRDYFLVSGFPKYYTNQNGDRIAIWDLESKPLPGDDHADTDHNAYNVTTDQPIEFRSGTEFYNFKRTLKAS